MEITESQIKSIVGEVLAKMQLKENVSGMHGVFADMNTAVAKAKEAGVVMTKAGATYPYGKDPKDSNIRIAPSFPTVEELKLATEIFVLSVKLVSIDKLLNA